MRLHKVWATALALSLVMVLAGGSCWIESYIPQWQTNQITAAQEQDGANPEAQKQRTDKAIATYTLWLAIATIGLGVATVGLYCTGIHQLQLGRQEFVASHRPFLKVQFVHVSLESEIENRIVVKFGVMNVGRNVAHVLGSCARADFFAKDEWHDPNDYGQNDVIRPRRFVRGATDRYTVRPENPCSLADVTLEKDKQFRLYGYIVYRDESPETRTTYFCRIYDPESDRFVRVNDPDYDTEYQD